MLPFILVLALAGAPKAEPTLAGRWLLGTETFCTLNANGKGALDGERIRWRDEDGTLVILHEKETERLSYTLAGDTLTLNVGDEPLVLKRASPADTPTADEEESRPGSAMISHQLTRLLLSSEWCADSPSLNPSAGRTRLRFLDKGTWVSGGQARTGNPGASGTTAARKNSGSGGQWAVKRGELYMSHPPETPSPRLVQPFETTIDSSGRPLLKMMGKEYSPCD